MIRAIVVMFLRGARRPMSRRRSGYMAATPTLVIDASAPPHLKQAVLK